MRPRGRRITRGQKARELMFDGLEESALTVLLTLGPGGKNVGIIRQDQVNFSTKDGVTVARDIHLEDLEQEYGANLLAQAAFSTSQDSGDGTTSTICLAYNLIKRFMASRPEDLREYIRGASIAMDQSLKYLSTCRKEITVDDEELKMIAQVSSNHDPSTSSIVHQAYKEVGKEGAIQIKPGNEDTLEVLDGMKVPYGWKTSHYYFLNDPRRARISYDDCYVLVIPEIDNVEKLAQLMTECFNKKKPIVLLYQEISDDCWSLLMLNRSKAIDPNGEPHFFPVCPIKILSQGDRAPHQMEDLAARTNCTYFTGGNEEVTLQDLGTIDHIEVTADETNLIAPSDTQAYSDHVERLRGELDSVLDVDREYLHERIARFLGKAAIIRVHGHIDQELQAKQFLVEDAVLACKTALEQGVMAGGGITYVWAQGHLDSEGLFSDALKGFNDYAGALSSIFIQIAENCYLEGDELLAQNKKSKKSLGSYDFKERHWKGTALDPYGSQVNVIDNAFSVFESFVFTDAIVTELPFNEEN